MAGGWIFLVLLGIGAYVASQLPPPERPMTGELRGLASASDGDSLRIDGRRIRIEGIDAPEIGQMCRRGEDVWDCGAQARQRLADLVAGAMRKVAEAMNKILDKDPGETFFIEGHTDAVGSDQSNLVLSDERAESVAVLLTEVYGIPAENLVTQGYGERFLKIRTDGPEQENRRVTIRRVTPLVRPVAQR